MPNLTTGTWLFAMMLSWGSDSDVCAGFAVNLDAF